jgi:hypothetical protein
MTEKSHERRAIVIGGSIAGLFVGAFLRRIGWRADIYERSSIELIGRGVGIFATHLELLEALDKCGAGTVDIGVIVYKRITFDRRGGVIAEKPQLQIVTSWDRLRQVLLKAIDRQRYHFGHVFERVEQDGSGVRVISPTAAVSAPTCLSDAMGSALGSALISRRRCSRFMPAITSGGVRPMNRSSRQKPAGPCFHIILFSWPISCRPSATRFRARTTNCAQASGATISAGIV